MRVVFAGTPDFAVPTLEALLASEHQVVACFTQPDRRAGRGRKTQASPVKRVAELHDVPVFQPVSFRDEAVLSQLGALEADVMVVVAYGQLLPQVALDLPQLGCLNVHASLLPRWRGAAPIHRAILAGDRETGVCVMQMAAGLDTGDVWSVWRCEIGECTTTAALHDTLAGAGAELLVQTLPAVISGKSSPVPQDDASSCYAHKLDKAESAMDWARSAEQLSRQVRAFNPWPVAQCTSSYGTTRIWAAHALKSSAVDATPARPGDVIAESSAGIAVQTGDGVLMVTRLQLPGKTQISSAEFLNGRTLLGQSMS